MDATTSAITVEEMGEAPAGVLHVAKDLPYLAAFLQQATQGAPYRQRAVLEASDTYASSFLAWQSMRLGGRAGLVVGNLWCRGEALPFTGFEGYFADTDLSAGEVAREEAHLGGQVLAELREEMVTAWPGAHRIDTSPAAVVVALRTAAHDLVLLRRLNAHFGAILGKLRAQETMQHGWYDPFKDTTYAYLASTLTYTWRGSTLHEQYDLPLWADRGTLPFTAVTLDDRELQGYTLMAELGRVGHPLIRGVLHSLA
jgi:hypothetical protein